MTMLLRLLTGPVQPWLKWSEMEAAGTATADPPLWAIREFTPTERDKAGLSVYEVDNDEDEALIIAGAFAFYRENLESGQIVFMAVDKQSLLDDGIVIDVTPGRLNHPFADTRHREIKISDLPTLVKVSRHFLDGSMHPFEGKEAGKAARTSAQANHLSYLSLSKRSFRDNWGAKNLVKFIGEQVVTVSGKRD